MNRIIYFRNMPLFGKSQKNPVEVVKQIKEAVVALEKGDKKLEKVSRKINYFNIGDFYLIFFINVHFYLIYLSLFYYVLTYMIK